VFLLAFGALWQKESATKALKHEDVSSLTGEALKTKPPGTSVPGGKKPKIN